MSPIKQVSRRRALRRVGELLGSIFLLRFVAQSRPAIAGTASKASMHYQDHPNDGDKCADCPSFRLNPEPDATMGKCKIVAGDIDPNGWCIAFSRR
ncbi:high-potential iron-sulfur protein [Paraherbaspirillum soli]|uniref:High-potential iron-sulfur protein n=1 Tax=Paraherbaspirillum soli TaxID=631222 RepID=A0ABW0M9U1_9BURK